MVVLCSVSISCADDDRDAPSTRTLKTASSTAPSSIMDDGNKEMTKDGAVTKVMLHPANDSGVSGSLTLKRITGGVEVKVDVRGLSEPEAVYLAHIHQGTCADEGEGGTDDHTHEHHSGSNGEIEYALSMVASDSEGNGSSTTLLWETTVGELLSGGPNYVNVHASGQGDPPAVACGNLSKAR